VVHNDETKRLPEFRIPSVNPLEADGIAVLSIVFARQ
jgi:hypothetical protein